MPPKFRNQAIVAGVLYIVATVAGILSVVVTEPIFSEMDILAAVSSNGSQLMIGALLELIMAAAILGIPVMLFSILKEHNDIIAIGYFMARVFEVIPIVGGVIILLCLQSISSISSSTGSLEMVFFKTAAILLRISHNFTDMIGTQIIFSLTALILNFSLYQTKAVPRVISVWGLIGTPLILILGLMSVFGVINSSSPISVLLLAPIALQEMVFAVWLIVKGFDPAVIESGK